MKTKTLVWALILLLPLLAGCPAQRALSSEEEAMVGFWHSAPALGGNTWGERYFFFPDGRFAFLYGQWPDESQRDVSFSGTWSVEEQKLILTITEKVVLEGGRVVEDAVGAQWQGAREKKKQASPPEVRTVTLTSLIDDDIFPEHPLKKTTFNGKGFWKIHDDPKAYIEQLK